MSFHLRPVSEISPSPSPTASASPPTMIHSPHSKGLPSSSSPSNSVNGRLRRPLSPSSLRDVDLTHTPDMPPRKYAAPLTGHDLMAMFPPAPPDNFPEMRAGPTSGYFQRQERAFFAQAGKEIVRVRVEVDLQSNGDVDALQAKSRARAGSGPRSWQPQSHAQSPSVSHHSPVQSPPAPLLYPPSSGSRPTQRGPVPVTTSSVFPITTHPPSSQLPPNLHPPSLQQTGLGLRTPPHDSTQLGAPNSKSEISPDEHDADEAWRRPMPYAERRRAGKHTRRVIVRT